MIPELGHYALILTLCLAIVQATLPLIGAHQQRISWMQLARFTACGQFFYIAISFFSLMYSFAVNDFNEFEHSSTVVLSSLCSLGST